MSVWNTIYEVSLAMGKVIFISAQYTGLNDLFVSLISGNCNPIYGAIGDSLAQGYRRPRIWGYQDPI